MRTRETLAQLAERTRDDFGAFAYDGFGVMLSDEQLLAREEMGPLGPREKRTDAKIIFLSGGQRAGKTVELGLCHADANLFKRGVDNTDRRFWRNYLYKTLAIAPSVELVLKLYVVMDELAKGSSDAQWDRRARRSRGGRFIGLMRAGKQDKWPTVFYEYGSQTDFRTSEGRATRLEGGQWWGVTWDEWATQPPHEIPYVLEDVLLGRTRDHDAKIIPAAWPKAESEHHLMKVIREIERGTGDVPKKVVYLSAAKAHFTNQDALATEVGMKDEAQIQRTVHGKPAGGAAKEFTLELLDNAIDEALPLHRTPEDLETPEGSTPWDLYRFAWSWDLGAANDETAGTGWAIPKSGVTPKSRAKVLDFEVMTGANLDLSRISTNIRNRQVAYGRCDVFIDASSMGGVFALRELKKLKPAAVGFVPTANHRIYGNVRLAAITNALEMLSWQRDPNRPDQPWGLIEMPDIEDLIDQMKYFDRDAKNQPDDRVWSFIIGCWYIRRYWVVGEAHRQAAFDERIMRRERVVPFMTAR